MFPPLSGVAAAMCSLVKEVVTEAAEEKISATETRLDELVSDLIEKTDSNAQRLNSLAKHLETMHVPGVDNTPGGPAQASREVESGGVEPSFAWCPGGHRWKFRHRPSGAGYACDECGRSILVGEPFKDCRKCDYSVCDRCMGLMRPA